MLLFSYMHFVQQLPNYSSQISDNPKTKQKQQTDTVAETKQSDVKIIDKITNLFK